MSHDAMVDAPELCAQCGKPLTDDEPDDCTADVYWRDFPDPEPWSERFPEPWIPRALDWPSVAVLLLATLLAVVIGTAGLEQVQARDTGATLTAPGPINGRISTWPAIGTDAYAHSCEIVDFYEDGSATAYCKEDSGLYRYDPEDAAWYPLTLTR